MKSCNLLIIFFNIIAAGITRLPQESHSEHWRFLIGKTTVAAVVYVTCSAIWSELFDVNVSQPSEQHCIYRLWQFSNRIGAIDGSTAELNGQLILDRHIILKKLFFVNIAGCSRLNEKLITAEVGGRGKQSDAGTFHYSVMESGNFNVLKPDMIPGTPHCLSCVLNEDGANPLHQNLMCPFP